MPIITELNTRPPDLKRAVNILLQAMGYARVMSLDLANMDIRAQDALSALEEQNAEIQSRGWYFNEMVEKPLIPNTEGNIILPNNYVRFKLSDRSAGKYRVAEHVPKLYDMEKHTYTFTETLYADMTLIFDFDQTPPVIRQYIIASAGFLYGANKKPDSQTYRFTRGYMEECLSYAEQYDEDQRRQNAPESSPHFNYMATR